MRAGLNSLGLGLVLWLAIVATAGAATLDDVRLWSSPEKTRVVLDLGGAARPDVFLIDNPPRLVIDLPDVEAASSVSSSVEGSGLIERVRTAARHGDDLRVVLDLAAGVDPESFMLAPDAEHGHRLVVDLRPKAGAGPPTPTIVSNELSSKDSSETQVGNPAARQVPSTDKPAVAAAPEPVARRPAPRSREIVVVIDPGHGGRDPGAVGKGGTYEKDVVLQIARRLKDRVDAEPNMRGVLTRNDDTYLRLRERTAVARRAKADLFISIHADAARHGRARGSSVYALSQAGATSEHARWLAQRENIELVDGSTIDNDEENLASFIIDLSQGASIEASLDVGERVLDELRGMGPLHKSKVQQAAFMVLKSPDIPSFLVETAFISTPEEERRLKTVSHQQQLADAMLRGIKGYFSSYRPETFIADRRMHRVRRGETLSGIAERYGVSVSRLRKLNDLSGHMIRVGAELEIPAPANQQLAELR